MNGKIYSLNGTWKVKGSTSDRGAMSDWPNPQPYLPEYDAPVPGTVQEAMEFVTGDVHFAHNVLNARFIEEQYWLYSRSFTLTEEDLSGDNRVRLVFEGLDLAALVYVNGQEAGSHADFYTPCRLDVTPLVHAGENSLQVRIESGIYKYTAKDISYGYSSETARQLRRTYMRKPQCQFEWDWSPRLLNVGIYKPCRIEIAPFFADECSVFHDLSGDYTEAAVRVRQFLNVPEEREVSVEARIEETGEGACATEKISGNGRIQLNFTIKNPKLWQPKGHGEQYRYNLKITVRDAESGIIISEEVKKIGIRKVEIDRSKRPAGGEYFRLLVNGERLFLKGGNMIPADILYSKLDRKAYEVLIDRAIENNFSALRVWGGGMYESDDFYDLCDEKGLVIWQDCVNACGCYPAFDKEFNDLYRAEIAYELRRLSMYASLVILCGNNEIDQFMQGLPQEMYTDASLYYFILPKILREEGDNHYYQTSSPASPAGYEATDFTVGDQHPWAIGFSNREYFTYRTYDCRFPNEGGILGPTSLPNMMAALGEGQKYIHSFDFKLHDNSIADQAACAPEKLLSEKLGIDMTLFEMPIPDYVYYGGFLQGEGLTEYALNFRRRMNDTTGSAIFWMYNDCWPATRSWTTIDYLRNRTPAFWAVKRAFSPIAVDIVKTVGGFDVYGINDTTEKKQARLVLGFANPDGTGVETQEYNVTLPANNSAVLVHFSMPSCDMIPFAELSVEGFPTARRRYVEKAYNTLGLKKSGIRVTKNPDGSLTYESDGFVFGVCLDLDGTDGTLSDNFFDLYPGRPYTVNPGRFSGEILYSYMG